MNYLIIWPFVATFGCLLQINSAAFPAPFSTPNKAAANGVLKLIIKTYVKDLLSAMSSNDELLRNKLLALSEHVISHPALYQRHLYVGQKPPPQNPDESIQELKIRNQMSKRQREFQAMPDAVSADAVQFPSDEICATNRQWEQVNVTHDFYDNEVEVIQEEDLQQFVFSYRCATAKGSCLGISPFYHSECTERYGWMYLYHKKQNGSPQWGYVAAPHHCSCKIQPKFIPTSPTDISLE